MKYFLSIFVMMAALLQGCATIIGEPTQVLPIISTPEGASVVITDETGTQVFKGTTPTTVTLEKSDGSYWGGKSFSVTILKEGYEPMVVPVKASPNGWYMAGNLIFGGLIGWFVVDPLNGDMYTLSAKEIDASLQKLSAASTVTTEDNVSIVLLDNVPEELRGKLVKVQ